MNNLRVLAYKISMTSSSDLELAEILGHIMENCPDFICGYIQNEDSSTETMNTALWQFKNFLTNNHSEFCF